MIASHAFFREEHMMNIVSMTPAALLHFLDMASRHELTDEETCAAVRASCSDRRTCVSLVDVETAVSNVLATRVEHIV